MIPRDQWQISWTMDGSSEALVGFAGDTYVATLEPIWNKRGRIYAYDCQFFEPPPERIYRVRGQEHAMQLAENIWAEVSGGMFS